jgi:(1->4)-alpha-D-glucan 1-alpha-D-glucosylmutase
LSAPVTNSSKETAKLKQNFQGIPKESEFEPNKTINLINLIQLQYNFYTEIKKWSRLNLKKKKNVNNKLVPNMNEEYYIYQTLIGCFPFEWTELPEFTKRLSVHMSKAVREAKINSTWASPNLQYEESVTSFVTELLELNQKNAFLQDFIPFQKKIAFYGFLNTLSQSKRAALSLYYVLK